MFRYTITYEHLLVHTNPTQLNITLKVSPRAIILNGGPVVVAEELLLCE